jgi:hypothetical protein
MNRSHLSAKMIIVLALTPALRNNMLRRTQLLAAS